VEKRAHATFCAPHHFYVATQYMDAYVFVMPPMNKAAPI
jgi:hypothetical protein